eukprot:156681_1
MGNVLSKFAQLVLGIALSVGGIAVTVMTGGAGLAVNMLAGAMIAGGIAGTVSSITGDGNWGQWLKNVGLASLAGMFFVPIIGDAFGHMVTQAIQQKNVIAGLWEAIAIAALATFTMAAGKLTIKKSGKMFSSMKTAPTKLKGNVAKAVEQLSNNVAYKVRNFKSISKKTLNDFVTFCQTIPLKEEFATKYKKLLANELSEEIAGTLTENVIGVIVNKAYENYMIWLATYIGEGVMFWEGIPGGMYQQGNFGNMYAVGDYDNMYNKGNKENMYDKGKQGGMYPDDEKKGNMYDKGKQGGMFGKGSSGGMF